MSVAKLVIKDEVNVKIEGLDLKERRHFSQKYKFEIPGARYQPSVRLGRWDGKVSFFQLSGSTYINLLPEILEYLENHNYEIQISDTRTYSNSFTLSPVTENTFSHKTWPSTHPKAGQPILFRDYQVELINNFLSNPQSVQEVATGAGKTIMTAALSYSVEKYGRSIVIVPNKSLVTQTEEDYKNLGLDVGVYFGDRKEFGHQHTICTWQSLNNLAKSSNDLPGCMTFEDFLSDVVCVIVDEVHMAKADVLKAMLSQHMGHIPIRWGLTGTIPKEEYAFVSIYCMIGNVIGRLSASELQEQGVLAQCHVNVIQLVDHAEYNNYQSELKFLLENSERLDYIGNLISNITDSGNTLILVDRIAAGKALSDRLPNSVFISSATKVTERKEHYDEVAEATNKTIIATYGVAAVGINIPRIFNLVLIEPGKSFVRVIQSIGRGIRKAEDKDFVQIWDITSTCKFAKRHLTKRKQFYKEANYPHTVEKATWK